MRVIMVALMLALSTSLVHGEDRKRFSTAAASFIPANGNSRHTEYRDGRRFFIGIEVSDNDASSVLGRVPMRPEWDGKSIQLGATMFAHDPYPFGNIELDWVGKCTYEESSRMGDLLPVTSAMKTVPWPLKALGGVMAHDMAAAQGGEMVAMRTRGDIPLNQCDEEYDRKKILRVLWLKGTVDARSTTLVYPHRYLFLFFSGDYAVDPVIECIEQLTNPDYNRSLIEPSGYRLTAVREADIIRDCKERHKK